MLKKSVKLEPTLGKLHRMSRICILGGGFGGLYTAVELGRHPWKTPPHITLVDQGERFVFLPLLYELLTGEMEDWEVAPRYRDLMADLNRMHPECPVHFRQGEVQSIETEARRVTLQSGETIEYDCLVLALGGDTPLHIVPGAAEHAYPFRQLADARRLRVALQEWESQDPSEPIRLGVAGAGASGVEIACKLADRLGNRGQIRVIERGPTILGSFAEASSKAAEQALSDRSISVELNTEVVQVSPDMLQVRRRGTEEIRTEAVDGVIWTVGMQVPAVIRHLSLPKTNREQLQIRPTLQVEEHDEIFALGDLAAVVDAEGNPVPASAQAAYQQASYCAWNLWALTTAERPLLPFRYDSLGEMLSLGMNTAVLSGMGITLSGPLGYLARRLIYLVRMPTPDHQMRVGWNWMLKPMVLEVTRWLNPV